MVLELVVSSPALWSTRAPNLYELRTEIVAGGDVTDAAGTYAIGGLNPGGYRVEVMPSGTFFMGEYFDDVPSYDPANVTQAETLWLTTPQLLEQIDFVLTAGGTFSGRVTDAATAGPLSSVPIFHRRKNSPKRRARVRLARWQTTTRRDRW